MPSGPIGIVILAKIFGFNYQAKRRGINIISVLILTFISYAALHACRKALPVVKNKLQGECISPNTTCIDGFDPFDKPQRSGYFALLDISWAFSYAIGMLLMGHAAEKSSRKTFLCVSLIGSGLTVMAFGMGYYFDIHFLPFYVTVQILSGVFQSAGWPTIISIVSSWVSKKTMGSVLGLWGNHYAVGNIIGQTIASIYVNNQWGMAFVSNGFLCLGAAFLVIIFLASKPKIMGFGVTEEKEIGQRDGDDQELELDEKPIISEQDDKPISFRKALFLPGVLEFSFSLFFCKIVIYTFLFWLPYYINSVGIKGYDINPQTAGFLAALFDVGGIVGNVISGVAQDILRKGGCLCFVLQILSCVSLFLFSHYGSNSYSTCIFLLIVAGMFVNAPNALITGTISASLGNKYSGGGKKRATTTISAIIDGVGSLGAAFAPLAVNQISKFGWNYVMYSLVISCGLSGLLLIRLVYEELYNK